MRESRLLPSRASLSIRVSWSRRLKRGAANCAISRGSGSGSSISTSGGRGMPPSAATSRVTSTTPAVPTATSTSSAGRSGFVRHERSARAKNSPTTTTRMGSPTSSADASRVAAGFSEDEVCCGISSASTVTAGQEVAMVRFRPIAIGTLCFSGTLALFGSGLLLAACKRRKLRS